jgi:2-keto-4-pentenoate hydratase/2-oxohepta-3-ene-1,7-dioic acid hydratase in catechol pathway
MKWISYEQGESVRVGRVEDGRVQPVAARDMLEVIRGEGLDPVGSPIPLDEVRVLAPITRPPNVIAIGLNYRDHAEESNNPVPEQPVVFSKFSNSVIGTGETIRIPPVTEQVDYEAELTVVIGRPARNVPESEALDYVFGYMNGNDVSARDLQFLDGKQWVRGKSIDTFGPMGPYLVTADEVPDPQNLSIRCTLNGEVVQDGHTSEMIFSVAKLVSYLSGTQTLAPGDAIMTGTPAGVIFGREQQDWLKPGDVVVVEVEGLGTLINPLAAE